MLMRNTLDFTMGYIKQDFACFGTVAKIKNEIMTTEHCFTWFCLKDQVGKIRDNRDPVTSLRSDDVIRETQRQRCIVTRRFKLLRRP